ncbi:RodZ family helix-turn-helix domain-containing protein [Companilactobacillus kedongensis]|uniref:hypothetical protein n=1 Tax=Companilactobacillus kedongensis TaxID=2486004 RepID=UPI000F776B0A|nr:hypothetical protein [Companilactobacillus kedongensis]
MLVFEKKSHFYGKTTCIEDGGNVGCMVTIGKYLRTKRFFKEMTLQQVVYAAKHDYNLSTSTSVLSALETNKTRTMDGALLFVLADLYDIDLNELRSVILEGKKEQDLN